MMIRVSGILVLAVLALLPWWIFSGEAAVSRATVRLEVVDSSGRFKVDVIEDLSFKNLYDGEDYAANFEGKKGRNIPYGTYLMSAHSSGFRTTRMLVGVHHPKVRVVVGLVLGSVGGSGSPTFRGKVKNLPDSEASVWVRMMSVLSSETRDAKVDGSGVFAFPRLPEDHYVLIIWSGADILDLRTVHTRMQEKILIDLSK